MPTVLKNLKSYLDAANQWFKDTPERALEQAYQAALIIKAIEDEYFEGQKICSDSQKYRRNAMSYFEAELKKQLTTAKVRLAEFNISTTIINSGNPNATKLGKTDSLKTKSLDDLIGGEDSSIVLEKLRFIDDVLNSYTAERKAPPSSALIAIPKPTTAVQQPRVVSVNVTNFESEPIENLSPSQSDLTDAETINDKTSFVPRSILSTLDRLKRNLDPKAEEDVVRNFRTSKTRTIISIKFILLLILVPLLTQQVTKNFLVAPLIDHFRDPEKTEIFLNMDMEEEAFQELARFEEFLKFKSLISTDHKLSPEEMELQLRDKAVEIEEQYRDRSANSIKNVFADMFAVGAFSILLLNSKREIAILKSFIDEVVYGLSDSAKAFIIILFTDIFVGFHSPHGWEVVLEGLSRHLGLPENRDFNFLFIATFPVILDTVFKYWIFRYLNRISPSAVATYRNMNE